MSVDAIEAVLKLAQAYSGLATITGGRIAQRHRYGQDSGDWPLNGSSLILSPAGGDGLLYVTAQKQLIEARCYGDTPYACGQVWRELVAFSRVDGRRTVVVTEGVALVYYVIVRAQPRLLMDEEIRPNGGMPAYAAVLEADVAETIVGPIPT
jgi:hypothetical protein